ncbi:Flagellar M-ring protein FliF [Thermogutta terrifontis]|jgi:flagellar M-ring protein FliF|uniref:Flagellar M-ring protein FliF n=1 Tax=Thermogutta terrifontis TaxID=1331910 RepID=A0A286RCQ8_9BACT|nr:flagellar M-ring protein FliF C-terminal domain-containing protein [Thermogutta terrifontis]ASV73697.1 Flagellar M-ring protein FliF [Thermogutta terrifontis]
MDFLNATWQQLRDLFLGMTPSMRITTALLFAAVVVSLGFLVSYSHTGGSVYLMNGAHFSPNDLPAMEAAFAAKGLNDYRIEGTRIRVPQGKQDKYMAALAEGNALPYNYLDILEKTIKESSTFEPRYKLEERTKIALQKELSRVISQMAGVQDAVVMFSRTNQGGLRRETVTTASVAIKPIGGQELSDQVIRSIRYYVAKSIGGLKPEDVVVTNMDTGANYYALDDQPLQAAEGTYALKRSWEQYFAEKVKTALGYVPGVLVSCNVELDPTKYQRQEQVKLDPKAVALDVTETTKTRQATSDAGGRVGYVAQGNTPRSLNSASTGPSETEEETQRTERNSVGQTVIQQETAGLLPKRVTVSVAIPASYFRRIWEQQQTGSNPSNQQGPTAQNLDKIRTEELNKIRTHIAALLPPAEGVNDPTQLVTVTDFVDMPSSPPPEPSITQQSLEFVRQYWPTLGLMALALVSLIVLRSTVRQTAQPVTGSPVVIPEAPTSTPANEASETQTETRTKRRAATGTRSLREEVAELVAEDPETAANILKAWIGNPV